MNLDGSDTNILHRVNSVIFPEECSFAFRTHLF